MLGNPENVFLPGLQKYPPHELVFVRSLISFSISAWVINQRKLPFFGTNKKLLLVRGLSGMIALTLFFFTLHKLPLAIASILQYLSPIFTLFIASIYLKENVSKLQFASSILAFIGVVFIGVNSLVFHQTGLKLDFFWMIMGILSAILSGIAYNAIAQLKSTEAPINIVIYFPMLALPITAFWCLFDFTFPRGIEWLILLIIGVCTQIAQVLMTRAFMLADTAIIAPFQYFGAIYALLSGWFLFHETLEIWSLIGIVLVLMGVFLGTLFRKNKKQTVA